MRRAIIITFISLAILFGFVLRFYHFPSNPPSLNWDEVSFGYNAYSVLKTGRDEFGHFLPMTFRSLDDYKLPVYMYATVLSVALFGLTDFAVRFPSAVFGCATLFLIYAIVKELIGDNRNYIQYLPFVAALFLGILPWHVQFSRMAAEANIGLFFVVLGTYLFFRGFHKPWMLVFSCLAFGLSMYSYISSRVISTLLIVYLWVTYRNLIKFSSKQSIVTIVIFCIIVGSIIHESFFQGIHIRFKATSIFLQSDIYKQDQIEMFRDGALKINIPRRIIHDSHIVTNANLMLRGYLLHFSPDFLFFDLDQKHHHTPGVGLVYLWMLPFFVIGIYASYILLRRLFDCMMVWLLVSPIPPSVTWDVPHAIRSESMVIPIVVFSGMGVITVFTFVKRRFPKIFLFCFFLFSFIVMSNAYYFFHQYMIHLPHERSDQWVYGRRELAEYFSRVEHQYDRIIVSTRLEWPYIFLLYYSRYDPWKYLQFGGTKSGGWGEEGNMYGKYEFRRFNIDRDVQKGELVLFIGTPQDFHSSIQPTHIIRSLYNTPAIYAFEKKGD